MLDLVDSLYAWVIGMRRTSTDDVSFVCAPMACKRWLGIRPVVFVPSVHKGDRTVPPYVDDCTTIMSVPRVTWLEIAYPSRG